MRMAWRYCWELQQSRILGAAGGPPGNQGCIWEVHMQAVQRRLMLPARVGDVSGWHCAQGTADSAAARGSSCKPPAAPEQRTGGTSN